MAKDFSFKRTFLYAVTKNHVLPLNIKQCPRYPSGSVESRQQFLSKLYCLLPENLEVKKKKVLENSLQFPINDISAQQRIPVFSLAIEETEQHIQSSISA